LDAILEVSCGAKTGVGERRVSEFSIMRELDNKWEKKEKKRSAVGLVIARSQPTTCTP
jgi:hypothetical protein